MAEPYRAVAMDPLLVEELIRAHFGAEYTSKITWDYVRGTFVPSDLPRRIATPQKVLGIRTGWKTLGQFTQNIGFRLELWDPAFLPQARGLVEEYNGKTEGTKLELYLPSMTWPASSPPAA